MLNDLHLAVAVVNTNHRLTHKKGFAAAKTAVTGLRLSLFSLLNCLGITFVNLPKSPETTVRPRGVTHLLRTLSTSVSLGRRAHFVWSQSRDDIASRERAPVDQ